MDDPVSLLVALLGSLVIAVVTIAVHRDASRLEFERPWFWAGLVCISMLIALTLHLAVGTIPVPGLLVIAVGGIALYLFERDDTVHGEDQADPHALPGSGPPSQESRRNDDE